MEIKEMIFALSEIPGPTGYEGEVMERVRQLLSEYTDEVLETPLGSIAGIRRCGRENAPLLLLDAHLDSVSMFVSEITESGHMRFLCEGIDPRMLPGSTVTILGQEKIQGVISSLPSSFDPVGPEKSFEVDRLFLDTGLTKEALGDRVRVGTPAVMNGSCISLLGRNISAPVLDDRSCFVTILLALEKLKHINLEVDIAVLASTMEEFGGMGAKTGAYALHPDYAIVLDVAHATTPDYAGERAFQSGGGPVIRMGPSLDRLLTKKLMKLGDERKLKYQKAVIEGNNHTNAWGVQVSREGIPTAILSVPVKYMHTPCETLCLDDVESTAEYLAAFIGTLREGENL